jgi:hypothetical protein
MIIFFYDHIETPLLGVFLLYVLSPGRAARCRTSTIIAIHFFLCSADCLCASRVYRYSLAFIPWGRCDERSHVTTTIWVHMSHSPVSALAESVSPKDYRLPVVG